ncbi:MAG: RluA family pseudouridine synthase [Planctomycetales bacterium]|nr:RluA family pseudouridine synthase [Planctomycetales bacterium]
MPPLSLPSLLIIRYTIAEALPLPARSALNIVQAALKVHRKVAEQLIHDGAVRCRGKMVSQTHLRLKVGDEVEIDYAPQPAKLPRAKAKMQGRFEVVHDDEQIIVVNKPAGLLTVPTPKREPNTLQSQIRKWLDRNQPGATATCVHRLDRGVSGLLVFAKSYAVADQLRSQFAARKPKRRYAAIVHGQVAAEQGTFKTYLATDDALNRYSVQDPAAGELAITHYKVKEQWADATLVQVQLETGRRNQIRVHFAEVGHPIIGDPRYRPELAEHPLWPLKRIALHAETLGLVHPDSGEELQFVAPWPQEFRDFRRRVRKK